MGFSLFRRSRLDDPLQVGAQYRRIVSGSVTETAEVLTITTDSFHIPHVRFMVRNNLPEGSCAPDQRTLSAESFSRLFNERVAS
ncbi:hypothetical protein [Nitrospirillum sp. BR 11163]|uniref:hypothetical protein n=1 Tax=Nitrospirillum sp. BR 11163 TaxID=3104323 RepID=UPI002AFFA526|nr:hypothetical protein [Nitrospirillum sp. BR 11163]MEA1673945.1 hypothetical protein [Nitrospirillum sp. BR 11163]